MIPLHLARRVLCDLLQAARSQPDSTLHYGSKRALAAAAEWTAPRDPIPPALAQAIRTGQVRGDTAWLMGAERWLVEMLDATEAIELPSTLRTGSAP